MLSLRRNISKLDQEDQLFRSALAAYLNAIGVIRDLSSDVEPEIGRSCRKALGEIEEEINAQHKAEVLDRSCDSLRAIAKELHARAEAVAAKKEEEMAALINAFGEAAQILGHQHSGQADRFNSFSNRLQETEKIPDLGLMRRKIVGHVRDLRTLVEQTRKENEDKVSALQNQLTEFSERLDSAEQRASRDSLTGLLNRGEGEGRLKKLIEKGSDVTAILVDLNGFKKINDTWGHTAGDQILKTCARTLSGSIRPGDLACRWGGDEFLVVLQCDETIARECAARIDNRLRTPQRIVVLGKVFEISASASIGIARRREEESVEDFVARADMEMYKTKMAKPEPLRTPTPVPAFQQ